MTDGERERDVMPKKESRNREMNNMSKKLSKKRRKKAE
jgi:hypothetical protein